MATGLLNVSLSGLNAAQSGIRTAQQNIANANTEGYHRQESQFSAATPQYSGGGYLGTGVNVDTVRRVYDQFLSTQTQTYQSQLSNSEAYSAYATQVDSLLGGEATGLGVSLQKFFSSTTEVANDPTSPTARQQMLSTGRSLASRFSLLSGNLQNIESAINQDIANSAGQINSYADQIKSLNGQISRAMNSGQVPNDLLDQREVRVNELNKLVNVSQIQQSDGTISVMLGDGQPLVVGNSVSRVSAVNDPTDPSRKLLALTMPGSSTAVPVDESVITGGRLGGLFAFRSEVLDPAVADLDLMAQSLADAFNTQHTAGYDLNGVAGGAFFSYSASAPAGTLAVAITQGSAIAAAGEGVTTAAGAGNSGNASISYATLSSDTARPLANAPYTLTYNAGNVTVTDATAATVGSFAYTSGSPMSFNGISVTLTGDNSGSFSPAPPVSIADGDTFTIDNSGAFAGPGDNSNALALSGMQRQAVVGGSTVSEYNISMIGRNATYANTADTNVASFSALHKASFDAEQSVSGVNLDEEAANLIRYQQAYQAAAKAIQVSTTLFDALLGVVR